MSNRWLQHLEILDRQTDFELQSRQRVFRLIQAMEANDQAVADKLVEAGVGLDSTLDLEGPESIPVPPGWKDLMGAPLASKRVVKISPLGWAAAKNQINWIDWLINAGASPSLSLHEGKDAAWLAMERGHQAAFAELVEAGASPRLRLGLPPRMTRLMGAVQHRQVRMVEILLQARMDPNESDDNWATALHYNFRQDPYTEEDVRIAELLLAQHADPLAEDRAGIQAGGLAKTDQQFALLEGYEIRRHVEAAMDARPPEPVDGPDPNDPLPGVPQLKRPYKKPRI